MRDFQEKNVRTSIVRIDVLPDILHYFPCVAFDIALNIFEVIYHIRRTVSDLPLDIVGGFFKLLHAFTQPPGNLGDLLRPEQQKYYDEYDHYFLSTNK